MCGIAGFLRLDSNPPDSDLLARMTRAIYHRGPDADGYYTDGPVALGHRRLSIIDLSGGAQPMSNEDETVWIVFNGEIFNFQALRTELEAKGHKFKTRSDTECIVHLYEDYGTGCAERLVGQFAFAIWDARRRSLYIARDHVGIKPLFYHLDDSKLLFASEPKAILEDESVERELDPDALIDYLVCKYVPAPGTIFKSIRKLPAGHWLLLRDGKLRIERFWDLPLAEPRAWKSEEDCARQLEELIRSSIKSQLMSDVPLGAFLSGGIDSSIVVGIMAGLVNRPVKTFTIGFQEEEFSEAPFARKVAERYHTEHHELIVEPESVDLFPRIVQQFDEPFADASAIPTYYVSRLARQHVTVALSGDGGDEAFGGYVRYQWALRYGLFDFLPQSVRSPIFRAVAAMLPEGRFRRASRRFAMHRIPRYAQLAGHLDGPSLQGLLAGDLRAAAMRRQEFATTCDVARRAQNVDYLTQLQYIDVNTYLPDDILVKTDRMSMLNSLEVRVPLLDHRVLEFATSIPPDWRLAKRIFKRAAGHLLPPELLHRPKMGFGVPLRYWFRGNWGDYARDLLLGQRARERGLLDPAAVRGLLERQSDERGGVTSNLYAIVVLEEWCRQYLDQPQSARSG